MADFDAILPLIGSFGKYQLLLCFLLCFPFCFYLTFVLFGQVFITLEPDHWCRIPDLSELNPFDRKLLSVPLETRDGRQKFSQCYQYDVNFTKILSWRNEFQYRHDTNGSDSHQILLEFMENEARDNWTTIQCQHGWEYNLDEVYETPLSQWNWVCDDNWKPYLLQSLFFVGCAIGCLVFGYLSDRLGRLPVLVLSNSLACLAGLATAFSPPQFWIFGLLRTLVGTTCDTCFMIYYILVLEYVDPLKRTLVSNLALGFSFALSTSGLPWIAYLIWDWRWFTVITSAPLGTIIIIWFILPESARWLMSRGREEEAMKIIENIAKINKRELTEDILVEIKKNLKSSSEDVSEHQSSVTLYNLFQYPNLRKRTLLLFTVWFLISLCYDGHARNTHNLGYSVFYTFTIASATELPAALVVIVSLDRIGRRWMFFASLTLGGVICIGIAAIPSGERLWLVTLAMLGRLLINISFNIGLQYAAELMPTVVRGQGVLATHFVGYIGNILGPFVVYLSKFGQALPLVVLGCLSVIAGVLCLFLPETLDDTLPQTLEEGEAFGQKQKLLHFPCCGKNRT